jgi:spoIIIJ-associated protein
MTDADTTDRDTDSQQPGPDVLEDTGTAGPDDLEERLVAEGEIAGDYL